MKLSAFFCLCLLLILLFSTNSPVSAELYQFVDGKGETHYTNDPATIPKQYQNSLKRQGEIIYWEEPVEPDTSTNSSYQEDSNTEDTKPAPEKQKGLSGTDADSLKAKELAFDNEFQTLKEERALLDKAKQEAKTKEEIENYNDQTNDFNIKYKDFVQRRQAFKNEVKEYNNQVMNDMEQKLNQHKKAEPETPEDQLSTSP